MEGSGKMVVTAVGPHSRIGIIMDLVSDDGDASSGSILKTKISKLAVRIGYFGKAKFSPYE
jgi:hypothetical protein